MTRPVSTSAISRKFLVALGLALFTTTVSAQTPTPTPTATPTPPPGTTITPGGVTRYAIPSGGRYDSANMVVEPDGTLWSASGLENVVAKISPDRTQLTRWTFPKDATPSSFLRDPDGSLWITELGGFKIAHFEPATGKLTEWADEGRRPTSFARRSDGTLWLPETSGALAKFDAVNNRITYYRSPGVFSLSYPWLDQDGTLWSVDFLLGAAAIVRFSEDGSHATIWRLPNLTSAPSRIIRGPDGKLWLTLYYSSQLARFDPETNELKTYLLDYSQYPYDLTTYRGLLVYSDQRAGYVGFFDPASAAEATDTLTPLEETTASAVVPVAPTTTVVLSKGDAISGVGGFANGFRTEGVVQYPVGSGAVNALAVDEPRGRIYFGTLGTIGALSPPPPATTDTARYLPSTASIAGRYGSRWVSELVAWNRGTPDTTGASAAQDVLLQLLPSTWILGYSQLARITVDAGKLAHVPDPIGVEISAPDSYGGMRLTGTTLPDDLFAWSRVSYLRPEGGTYGSAQSAVTPDAGIGPGETGFVFTTPDPGTQRTNAGLLTLTDAKGTVSLVDSAGTQLASSSFDWPAGYHWQGSTIFQFFGVEPVPDARVVFTVSAGKILPFGISIDNTSNDPIGLEVLGPKNALQSQRLLGVARGAGPLGAGATTSLQLFAGSAAATVTLTFLPAGDGTGAGAPVTGTVVVPAGQVTRVADVLASIGVTSGYGSLELSSDIPVQAFARVTASSTTGGTYGYGLAGSATSVEEGKRGVFLGVTDNGPQGFTTDLLLANISDTPATVDVILTDADAAAAGTRTVTLPPHTVFKLPDAWSAIAGSSVDVGRVEVRPADGSGAVAAELLRRDRITGDADPIAPFVIAR